MRQKQLRLIASTLCLAAIVIAISAYYIYSDTKTLPDLSKGCPPTIQLAMGEHLFSFPRLETEIRAIFNGEQEIDSWDVLCVNKSSPPPKATTVLFLIYPSNIKKSALNKYGGMVVSWLNILPQPRKSDTYETSFEKGFPVDLSSLPLEEGFYTLQYEPKSFFLIPDDKTFVTPQGNPVVFSCTRLIGDLNRPTVCKTEIAWRKNMSVSFGQISEEWLPRKEFKNFYGLLLKYVEKLDQK